MNTSLVISNPARASQVAQILSQSDLIPAHFKGKPAAILMALQWAHDTGMPISLALQKIYVVRDRPAMMIEAIQALVLKSGLLAAMKQEYDAAKMIATCTVTRKDTGLTVSASFSKEEAILAKLWGKEGSAWSTYPARMLAIRARGWALRDAFSDVINGMEAYEELKDFEDSQTQTRVIQENEQNLNFVLEHIKRSKTIEELKGIASVAAGLDAASKQQASAAWSEKANYLRTQMQIATTTE